MAVALRKNEDFKTAVKNKNLVIKNLRNEIKNLEKRNERLLKKIQEIKGFGNKGEVNIMQKKQKGFDLVQSVLNSKIIPESLVEFRKLPTENNADLIKAIMDKGISSINKLRRADENFQTINSITQSFHSYFKFSEKLNSLIKAISHVTKFYTFKEIMINVSKTMESIFLAENVHFWFTDDVAHDVGVFYTYTQGKKLVKCLDNEGLFKQVIENGNVFNNNDIKKHEFLYETSSEDPKRIRAKNAILVPVKNNNGLVVAILEISNLKNTLYGEDEQYFAIVLSNFLQERIETCVKIRVFKQEIKIKNEIFKSYLDLCKAHSYFEATEKIKNWTQKIFGYNHEIKIIFYQKGLLQQYIQNDQNGNHEIVTFSMDKGVIGYVAKSRAPTVIKNMKTSQHFSKEVDLNTVHPVITFPLLTPKRKNKQGLIGVVQTVFKFNIKAYDMAEMVLGLSRTLHLGKSLENIFMHFSYFISEGIKVLKTTDFDDDTYMLQREFEKNNPQEGNIDWGDPICVVCKKKRKQEQNRKDKYQKQKYLSQISKVKLPLK